MRKSKKEILLNVIGIILIISTLIRWFTLWQADNLEYIFWLSNHIPLIIGLGILTRNVFLIGAELSLIFVGEIVWCIDYLSKLIFNFHLFGSTEYMFNPELASSLYLSSLTHFLVVPLGLIGFLLLNKKANRSWIGAIIHIVILMPFVLYFGSTYNLNCLFESCVSWIPTFSFYPLVYSLVYFILFVIPINILLNKLVKNDDFIKRIREKEYF